MFLLLADTDEVRGLYPPGPQTLAAANPRGDAGVDLRFPVDREIPGGQTVALDLGVRAAWLAPGGGARAFFLMARSSLTKTPLMLANSVGLVDQGYRGTLKAAVWNRGSEPFWVRRGEALFQLAAADLSPAEFEVLQPGDLRAEAHFGTGATLRGEGGFGSTGPGGGTALGATPAALSQKTAALSASGSGAPEAPKAPEAPEAADAPTGCGVQDAKP
jgi:dUTP pyrophosphatase